MDYIVTRQHGNTICYKESGNISAWLLSTGRGANYALSGLTGTVRNTRLKKLPTTGDIMQVTTFFYIIP
jgi:hypothetical protein